MEISTGRSQSPGAVEEVRDRDECRAVSRRCQERLPTYILKPWRSHGGPRVARRAKASIIEASDFPCGPSYAIGRADPRPGIRSCGIWPLRGWRG
jgi:hypothetical protein